MKKLILLFIGSILLSSCGGDKKKKASEEVVVKDNYSVVLQAIYEKDDEVSVIYKIDGFWDYDHPVVQKVTGQPLIQKVSVAIPEGKVVENSQITLSTNKEQKTLTVNGISIFNNGKQVFNGDNLTYGKYFDANTGLTWDDKNLRYNLIFTGKYPPGLGGNDQLEGMLIK